MPNNAVLQATGEERFRSSPFFSGRAVFTVPFFWVSLFFSFGFHCSFLSEERKEPKESLEDILLASPVRRLAGRHAGYCKRSSLAGGGLLAGSGKNHEPPVKKKEKNQGKSGGHLEDILLASPARRFASRRAGDTNGRLLPGPAVWREAEKNHEPPVKWAVHNLKCISRRREATAGRSAGTAPACPWPPGAPLRAADTRCGSGPAASS